MSITEKITKNTELTFWKGKIPVSYVYTYGIAGEKYFREIKENAKLVGTKCKRCNFIYLPPQMYCERCFERLEDYIEVGSRGVVHTYTLCYEKMDGKKSDQPAILALVRIKGTQGGVIHWLGEVALEKVEIGMEVEAVFKPKRERKGSILDIKYFKPI